MVGAALSLLLAAPAAAAPSHAELAAHWAPVHLQHHVSRADAITRFDFDGDWDPLNNWRNFRTHETPPAVYYSVVETRTHWFLVYAFFHPRDWTEHWWQAPFDAHENDLEGALFALAKSSAAPWGTFKAAVTVSHLDFYSFVPAGGDWRAGGESVDGEVRFRFGHRPVTEQEAYGHGLKMWNGADIAGPGTRVYRPEEYQLLDIFGPEGFGRRDVPRSVFTADGLAFRGRRWANDKARPPWGWDDPGDGVPRGAFGGDPARLMRTYFTIPEAFSTEYVSNPYSETWYTSRHD